MFCTLLSVSNVGSVRLMVHCSLRASPIWIAIWIGSFCVEQIKLLIRQWIWVEEVNTQANQSNGFALTPCPSVCHELFGEF